MRESEAREMLKAYLECDKRKNEVAYEKQCHEECDNCELCYAQGTVVEHKEAVKIAIKSLENIEKIKAIITDNRKQYRECWEEIENILKEV